ALYALSLHDALPIWLHTDASGDRAPTGPGRRMGSVPADIGRKPGAVVRHPLGRHAAPLHHLIIKPAVHLGAPAAESACRSSPANSPSSGRPRSETAQYVLSAVAQCSR